MKKCPYCAEEIPDEAVKCRHCGEALSAGAPRPPGADYGVLRILGALMFVIGAAATVYYAKYSDVTVEVPVSYVAGYPI